MGWSIKRISHNKNRAAQAIRKALEEYAKDSNSRGISSVATAVETVMQAFGNVDWYGVEIETQGEISPDGKGYLTITVRTVDQDTLV